jgi:diacylglycerol kinase (ATP)
MRTEHTERMHIALLANPVARSGAGLRAAQRAAEHLRHRGVRTTLLQGGSAAESTALLHAALEAAIDAVVVAGGDGTVHLAVQELAGTGIPLGVIPAGTGNDLAAALGIPVRDPEAAADVVADGHTRRMDLAHLTRADGSTTLYATVLASGFDSRVNDRANAMRWPRGRSRYTLAILREVVALRGIGFALEVEAPDGSLTRVHDERMLVAVGNTQAYGGGIPMCPDADPTDGVLDLTLISPVTRRRLLRLLPRVYRGTHVGIPEVTTLRARAVSLSAAGVTAYADGEPMGGLPLRVEVRPRALSVLAPRIS